MGLDMIAGWAEPQPKTESNVVPIKKEPLLIFLLFFQQVHVLAQFCFIQAFPAVSIL